MTAENIHKFWEELVGHQLSSIEFVQDYIQLKFDGPCINVTNPLIVKCLSQEITSWDTGFRDLLCGQIAKMVFSVHHETEKSLVIRFTDDSQIMVSLKPEDYMTAEAFYAHGFSDNGWLVG